MNLTIAEQWHAAVSQVSSEYSALPQQIRLQVLDIIGGICALKEQMARLVTVASSEEFCAACNGECCRHGRHHFSVADLLGYLAAGEPLFEPDFSEPVCPYMGLGGCKMPAGRRPFNCVIFLCEAILNRLPGDVRIDLEQCEQELRRKYGELEAMFQNRFANGLLITFERAAAGDGCILNINSSGAG